VPKYSREVVAQVLAANDIVDVVGSCVELKPAGSGRFKACCPFHNEKTPSFTVSRDRQQYYCFGCEKHGDAIGFLIEFEGLTFIESLRKLADRGGVRLPAVSDYDDREDHLRAQLVEAGKFAARFFQDCIGDVLKGGLGRQYLKTRELKPETVKRFGLGYAPDGGNRFVEAARAKGFKDNVIEASGLARRNERGLFDFFRNRLMIPIRDISGNPVAFGGRDLGDGVPKYINSPENALYKKTRTLYGLFEAREGMRREKRVLLVEGYFDLMRCFDAGIDHVVATCGTALTAEQAALIRRYVPEVVIVYDADLAGIRAALRGVSLLTNAGLTVRAMTLPDGKDPDEYIRKHGPESFRALADAAADFVTFYVRMSENRLDTIEGRTAVARELFVILAGINDELRVNEYLRHMARALQLGEWACRSEFARLRHEQEARPPTVEAPPRRAFSMPDRDFIAALLQYPGLLERAHEALNGISLQPGPVIQVLKALWEDNGASPVFHNDEDAGMLYAAAANWDEITPETAANIVAEYVKNLKRALLKAESENVQRLILQAERAMDRESIPELLRQKAGIDRQIQGLGAA